MKFFRSLLTIIFAGIIIFWLWKWYATDATIQKNDIMKPVWDKLATLVTQKQANKEPVQNDTTPIIKNKALHPDVTQWKITDNQFETLVWNNAVIWPAKAEWTLFSYCDFDSVYCKQMIEEGTLWNYQLISNDSLQIVHKSYVTSFSWLESTYNTHHAWRCAQEKASWPQRSSLFVSLFNFPYQTIQQLLKEWQELWIEWFSECLLGSDSTIALQKENALAKELFKIKALPTLIFTNNKTQEWYSIPGLYTNEELTSTFSHIFDR